jgi:tight adherence protein C
MSQLIAILSAAAIAVGFGSLIGILIGGAARRAPREAPDGPAPATEVRSAVDRKPLGQSLGGIAPKAYVGWLERQILYAGRPNGWTVDRIVLAKPVLTVVLGLLVYLFAAADPIPLRVGIAIFVTLLAFFVPDLLILSRAQERQEKIQLALPDTLDQMTISVEAGLGFESAMAKAGTNGSGPLADELIRTLQDMSIGRSRKDAYEAFGKRTTSQDLKRFTRSVIQADIYGIAIADVLRVQAGEMRVKRRQRAEEKAMKVPIKVLFPLVFCILPVLFIVLLTPAVLGIIDAFS